jgi:hypothetical protein
MSLFNYIHSNALHIRYRERVLCYVIKKRGTCVSGVFAHNELHKF